MTAPLPLRRVDITLLSLLPADLSRLQGLYLNEHQRRVMCAADANLDDRVCHSNDFAKLRFERKFSTATRWVNKWCQLPGAARPDYRMALAIAKSIVDSQAVDSITISKLVVKYGFEQALTRLSFVSVTSITYAIMFDQVECLQYLLTHPTAAEMIGFAQDRLSTSNIYRSSQAMVDIISQPPFSFSDAILNRCRDAAAIANNDSTTYDRIMEQDSMALVKLLVANDNTTLPMPPITAITMDTFLEQDAYNLYALYADKIAFNWENASSIISPVWLQRTLTPAIMENILAYQLNFRPTNQVATINLCTIIRVGLHLVDADTVFRAILHLPTYQYYTKEGINHYFDVLKSLINVNSPRKYISYILGRFAIFAKDFDKISTNRCILIYMAYLRYYYMLPEIIAPDLLIYGRYSDKVNPKLPLIIISVPQRPLMYPPDPTIYATLMNTPGIMFFIATGIQDTTWLGRQLGFVAERRPVDDQ